MQAFRVLVCGGRDYTDCDAVYAELDAIHAATPIACVINGGASGADGLAADWAASRGVASLVVFPDWKTYGRAAGPIRNRQMLTEGKPSLVLAFPGGRGTADMVRQSQLAGVAVRMYRKDASTADEQKGGN